MFIPQTWRKKALFIIDVQTGFIIYRNKYIIPNIIKLIQQWNYDLIVYSIQYNDENSLWYKQIGWCEWVPETDTIPEVKKALEWKKNLKVNKLTRSIWKCDENLKSILEKENIKEVHLCWYESNDCVFASALESFDLGYYTFVIEEATETRTTASNHPKAIDLMNYLNLTNNSNYVGKN